MRSPIPILRNTGIFLGTSDDEITAMCRCLNARREKYPKGEFVLRSGDPVDCLGVVLDGRVDVIKQDWWGNRTLVSSHGPGDVIFAEYACSMGERWFMSTSF